MNKSSVPPLECIRTKMLNALYTKLLQNDYCRMIIKQQMLCLVATVMEWKLYRIYICVCVYLLVVTHPACTKL